MPRRQFIYLFLLNTNSGYKCFSNWVNGRGKTQNLEVVAASLTDRIAAAYYSCSMYNNSDIIFYFVLIVYCDNSN